MLALSGCLRAVGPLRGVMTPKEAHVWGRGGSAQDSDTDNQSAREIMVVIAGANRR